MNAQQQPEQEKVRVAGLSIGFAGSGVPVVADVDFAIRGGEVLGLVGESGSGKTTLGLALLGHARRGLRILSGSVHVGELDVLSLPPGQLRRVRGRRVAYVPQDPASALNPAIRVGAQVREALAAHAGELEGVEDLDARVLELMEEVRLPATRELLQSYPHQLSGGQQQRIGIAIGFACRPDLIVLDEPTTGLDVSTQRHVLETIETLTRSYGVAGVYVSHDLPVVNQVADRVAVLYAGRIVELGETADLMRRPAHPYSIGLLRAAPSPERRARLTGIEGRPPRPGRWPDGCAFASRCALAAPQCTGAVPPLLPAGPGGQVARCVRLEEAKGLAERRLPADAGEHAAGDAVLAARGVVARYGAKEILHGVDLAIPQGACVAVVGESGSGKTTLARCLSGQHANWDGELLLNGHPVERRARERSEDDRRTTQYVFQNPYTSLNPRRTIGESLEEPLRLFCQLSRAERRRRVAAVLEDVALGAEFAGRYPDQLSGGERQRVAIGRALIVEPTLLICDEVTSALDVSVQAVVIELLRRTQQERGISMLFITHNIAVVRSIAQEVVVLERGSVVERGPVAHVLDAPSAPYTQQLLADAPKLARPQDPGQPRPLAVST